jgi:hypothetical protein
VDDPRELPCAVRLLPSLLQGSIGGATCRLLNVTRSPALALGKSQHQFPTNPKPTVQDVSGRGLSICHPVMPSWTAERCGGSIFWAQPLHGKCSCVWFGIDDSVLHMLGSQGSAESASGLSARRHAILLERIVRSSYVSVSDGRPLHIKSASTSLGMDRDLTLEDDRPARGGARPRRIMRS